MAGKRGPAFYFTVAMILLFSISLFSVLLSVPQDSGGQASGQPTPQAAQFKGFAAGSGRVIALGSQLIIQCGSPAEGAVGAVEAVEGVSTAFQTGSSGLIVAVVNASNDAGEVAGRVAVAVLPKCTSLRILRSSLVEFTGPVELAAVPDSAVKESRTIYPLEARGYGLQTANLAGVSAYLEAISTRVNDTVPIYVSATLTGSQITELVVEQQNVGEIRDTHRPLNGTSGNQTGGEAGNLTGANATGTPGNATSGVDGEGGLNASGALGNGTGGLLPTPGAMPSPTPGGNSSGSNSSK